MGIRELISSRFGKNRIQKDPIVSNLKNDLCKDGHVLNNSKQCVHCKYKEK